MAGKLFERNPFAFNIRGNLIAGVLALAPIIAVWLVFNFLLDVLFQAGRPIAHAFADFVAGSNPSTKPLFANAAVEWLSAVFAALLVIYIIGFVTSRVIGRRLMDLLEQLIVRIPLVETIYSSVKKLVAVVQHRPDGTARVVLIEFPHPGARAIGLVTRQFRDAVSGEELASVLVPTAPNPTTGYLQIVPMKNLTPTDMSMDQAMTMIVSGGTTAPDGLTLQRAGASPLGTSAR